MHPAAPQPWLVKQEPDDYPFAQLAADGRTAWTGVRNFQARNSLRVMRVGDPVLYYHTGREKAVAGLAEVVRAAYPDPTAPADGEGWVCVDLAPVRALAAPVTLARVKAEPALADIALLRQSRLSVLPLQTAEFRRILELAASSAPRGPFPHS